jgi:hypothetical protein
MVALMVMQHAVQRYWSLNVSNSSAWQDLLFVVFISYPMITLMLVVLTNNEICVRRFMYYRLMSLQVNWRDIGGNWWGTAHIELWHSICLPSLHTRKVAECAALADMEHSAGANSCRLFAAMRDLLVCCWHKAAVGSCCGHRVDCACCLL